jgi:hypothetical protein
MASIAKRPDGRYRARYRGPDGKEHARTSLGRSTRNGGWTSKPRRWSPVSTSTLGPAG